MEFSVQKMLKNIDWRRKIGWPKTILPRYSFLLLVLILGLAAFLVLKESEKVAQQPFPAMNINLKTLDCQNSKIVKFVHFAQGYSIEYPEALNSRISLRGAGGGNFYLNLNSPKGKESLLIFSSKDWQKGTDVQEIFINGKKAFKTESERTEWGLSVERIAYPVRSDKAFIFEHSYQGEKSLIVDGIIKSIELIPPIPDNWKIYSSPKIEYLRFKIPPQFKVEALQQPDFPYKIVISGNEGEIIFTIYSFSQYDELLSSCKKYFAIPEQDEKGYNFALSAFTFRQGGDRVLRKVDILEKKVIFYVCESTNIYEIEAPLIMETILNQILMSFNTFYLE